MFEGQINDYALRDGPQQSAPAPVQRGKQRTAALNEVPLEVLRGLFEYHLVSGAMWWKSGRRAGKRAGTAGNVTSKVRMDAGYAPLFYVRVSFQYDGRTVGTYAHNIAHYLITGYPPNSMEVDHHNHEGRDNSWFNLRPGTASDNNKNRRRNNPNRAKPGQGVRREASLRWANARKKRAAEEDLF